MPQQWDDGDEPSPENDPNLPPRTPFHGDGDYDYEVVDPDAAGEEEEFDEPTGELDEEIQTNRPIARWLPLLILIALITALAWPREGCAIREKVRTIESPPLGYSRSWR